MTAARPVDNTADKGEQALQGVRNSMGGLLKWAWKTPLGAAKLAQLRTTMIQIQHSARRRERPTLTPHRRHDPMLRIVSCHDGDLAQCNIPQSQRSFASAWSREALGASRP